MHPAAGRAVLVVDDDVDLLDALLQALVFQNYRAVGARNGKDALQKLAEPERPAVILLDLTMPVMDGRAFRAAQRQDGALSAIPVVILSAQPDLPEVADELAAAGFLKKPFSVDALFAMIARFARTQ